MTARSPCGDAAGDRRNRINLKHLAAVLAFTLGGATGVRGQGMRTVRGVVVDTSGHRLEGVNIELAGVAHVVSDDSGRFSIRVPNRLIIFDVKRLGFTPTHYGVRPGADTTIRVMLLPAAQQLAGVDVTAKASDLNGFADRMQAAKTGTVHGIFITADDIAKRNPSQATQMFEGLPGVSVVRYRGNRYLLVGRQMEMAGKVLAPCLMSIYVDGTRIGSTLIRTMADGGDIASYDFDELVQPTNIAGIEFYESALDAPTRYQLINGGCGVVLIWTKQGSEKSP